MAIVNRGMSQFAVIGLGKFGRAITRELSEQGKEVLAVDLSEEKVNMVGDYATHSVICDASDEQSMKALGLRNFDAVIVCMGSNMQASILATLICKEQGASFVIAKSNGRNHTLVLKKIGADLVVEPEEEMAHKLAVQLVSPHLNDVMELKNFTIAEVEVPERWTNRTLVDIDMRRKYGVTLLVIKRGEKVLSSPSGENILYKGDSILIGGATNDITKFLDKLADM